MATGRRSKRKLKTTPKHKQKRSLATRRRWAKRRGTHKRSLARSRARRRNRGSK